MNFVIPHLRELRSRILKSLAFFCCAFWFCYFFRNEIVKNFIKISGLTKLVSIRVFEVFLTEIKIAFFFGFLISLPYFLIHIWGFVKIALFPREKVFARRILLGSISLFFFGSYIAYHIVIPMTYSFLMQMQNENIESVVSISSYVSFFVNSIWSFGLGFQFPIMIVILHKLSILTTDRLKNLRKVFLSIIVIIASIITPPDILSPIILTSAIYGMYELIILYLRKF